MTAEKRCSKCGEVKPLTEFHQAGQRSRMRDGRRSECRICTAAYDKLRYARMDQARRFIHEEQSRRCRQAESYKRAMAETQRANRRKYPDKRRARDAARRAFPLVGVMCQLCGIRPAIKRHHWAGYERENWLKVWLCCHECECKVHKKHNWGSLREGQEAVSADEIRLQEPVAHKESEGTGDQHGAH